jgi:choline dehydrogenase
VVFQEKRATGVEVVCDRRTQRITAGREVVLSLGAIHTPKVLMQSGIGDQEELRRWGIPVVEICRALAGIIRIT